MFQTIIGAVSSFMYSKLLVIILIGAGLYFTIRTRFPQVRLFERACESVMEKPDDKEAISSFQALMVSTASRVGTGNIVGVSSAICIGGFGSVFWMWVIAIIGSASAVRWHRFTRKRERMGNAMVVRLIISRRRCIADHWRSCFVLP